MTRRTDKLPPEVGARIRQAREKAGVTQYDLGEWSGVRNTQIGKIESGQSVPGTNTLLGIAQGLRVSLDWLLTGREPGPAWGPPQEWLDAVHAAVESYLAESMGRDTSPAVAEQLRRPENWAPLRAAKVPSWKLIHALRDLLERAAHEGETASEPAARHGLYTSHSSG